MLIPEEKGKQQELDAVPRSPGTPTISEVSSISPSTRNDTEGGDLPPAYAPPNNDVAVHRSETSEPLPITKPSTPLAGPSSPPPLAATSTFAGVKPSNLLFVQKDNSSIKGTFVIDSSLHVPEAALSPLPEGEKRHNAFLLSKNGSVHADIHLSFPPSKGIPEKGARTSLLAKSHNGSVTLKARRDPADPTPISLRATSENGSVDIYLPRNFEGPITLSTKHGSMKRSPAMLDHSTLFYESGGIQRGFVGDHTTWGADPENWKGDEALLESKNGSVRVWFVDEGDYSTSASSGKGFFSKFFRS